jgi:hypothetical protein
MGRTYVRIKVGQVVLAALEVAILVLARGIKVRWLMLAECWYPFGMGLFWMQAETVLLIHRN